MSCARSQHLGRAGQRIAALIIAHGKTEAEALAKQLTLADAVAPEEDDSRTVKYKTRSASFVNIVGTTDVRSMEYNDGSFSARYFCTGRAVWGLSNAR